MKKIKIAIPGLLILLLASTGCSKEETFDISGRWSFSNDSKEVVTMLFSGTVEKGTLIKVNCECGTGSYSVSGKEVVFDFVPTFLGSASYHFRGLFVSKNSLSGTMNMVAPYPPFDWTLEVEGRRL